MRLSLAFAFLVALTTVHMTSVSGQEAGLPVEVKPPTATPDLSLSFEVASVKPSASSEPRGTFSIKAGTFLARNQTLNRLIAFAFDVRLIQIVGSPQWAGSQRWEIHARMPPGWRWMEEHEAMLRRLLETRFALKHRSEIRRLPIYELRRARQDGTLGPNLTPFEGECKDFRVGRDGTLEASADAPGIRCSFGISSNRADAVGTDWTVLNLARQLTELDRLVVDKTGLTGRFNVKLRWSAGPRDSSPEDVSLFTALREQLGLTLEPAIGPVQVIVVEDARLPTPD